MFKLLIIRKSVEVKADLKIVINTMNTIT